MCLLAVFLSFAPISTHLIIGGWGSVDSRGFKNAAVLSGQDKGSVYSHQVELITEPVPYPVIFKTTSQVLPGRLRKVQYGIPGVAYRAVQKTIRGDKVVRVSLLWETIYPAVPAIILVGDTKRFVARSSYLRTHHLKLEATAYCPGGCCGTGSGRTASGVRAGFGVAAVDPSVVPLGSVLYVEGYGFALAADVGKGIRGRRIDLGFASHAEAKRFGRRSIVVHLLREG